MNDSRPLLRELLRAPVVAYHPRLAPFVGGVKAAVLLSQLYYLANCRDDPDAAFGASLEELERSTGLSAKEQLSARQALVRRGLVSVSRKGSLLGRNQYRLDLEALVALAAGQLTLPGIPDSPVGSIQILPLGQSRLSESAHLDSPNGSVSTKRSTKSAKERLSPRPKSGRAVRPPAVELFRRIMHRYPNKTTWRRIDRAIGSDFPALLRWGRVLRQWVLSGHNPTNILDMLDVFKKGWRPAGGNGRPGNARQAYDPAADMAAFKNKRGLK